MAQSYIGEIRLVPYNFAPYGWAACDGSLIPINQNDTLFSLLGTTFGGDGQTTFGLPDLSGRVPVHMGQGPGLSPCTLGQLAGAESVTLAPSNLPSHTHSVTCLDGPGNAASPGGNYFAQPAQSVYAAPAPGGIMQPPASVAGNNQPHNNLQPSGVGMYVISLYGVYPSPN